MKSGNLYKLTLTGKAATREPQIQYVVTDDIAEYLDRYHSGGKELPTKTELIGSASSFFPGVDLKKTLGEEHKLRYRVVGDEEYKKGDHE